MKSWAFIFVNENLDPEKDHTELVHGGENGPERMFICGVNSHDCGIKVAKRLVEEEHCWLIELCGGFDEASAKRVKEAVGKDIQVGYVLTI